MSAIGAAVGAVLGAGLGFTKKGFVWKLAGVFLGALVGWFLLGVFGVP